MESTVKARHAGNIFYSLIHKYVMEEMTQRESGLFGRRCSNQAKYCRSCLVEASKLKLSEFLPQTSSHAEINDSGLLGWRERKEMRAAACLQRASTHWCPSRRTLWFSSFYSFSYRPLLKIMTLLLAFYKRVVKKRAALGINGWPHQGQSMDGVLEVSQGVRTPSQNCPGTFEQGSEPTNVQNWPCNPLVPHPEVDPPSLICNP